MACHNTSSRVLERKNFLGQEYQDFVSIAIFVSMSFKIEHFDVEDRNLFPSIPGPHL